MQTRIQPINFFRQQATILRIDSVQVRSLGEGGSAFIFCSLLNDDNETLHNSPVEISGNDYSAWGSDDNYILQKAIETLGVVVE